MDVTNSDMPCERSLIGGLGATRCSARTCFRCGVGVSIVVGDSVVGGNVGGNVGDSVGGNVGDVGDVGGNVGDSGSGCWRQCW